MTTGNTKESLAQAHERGFQMLETAVNWYQEALKRAREGSLLREQARALRALGTCTKNLGQYEGSVAFYQESLRIWDQIGGPYERASIRQALGNCYVVKPDYEMALRTFEQARDAGPPPGAPRP